MRGRMRGAFVEDHSDIGSQGSLDFHGFPWSQEDGGPVDVRLEMNAVRCDVAQVCQAEYLVSAAVGEDGSVPGHESVESTGFTDYVDAGSQCEVVGISEEHLCAHFLQFVGCHGFNGCLGADRHEDGCIQCSMWSGVPGEASGGGGVGVAQLEGHRRGDR